MKISKILGLLSATLLLVSCGSNDKGELTPKEKLIAAFDMGENFKASFEAKQSSLDEDGNSTGDFIMLSGITRDGRKFETYSKMSSTFEYSLTEFLALCSEEFETTFTVDDLAQLKATFALMGMEINIDEANDKVTLLMTFLEGTTFYSYESEGVFKDIYALEYSQDYGETSYTVRHVLNPMEDIIDMSMDESYADHFTYNESEDLYYYNPIYATEDEIDAESINKYTVSLKDGKVDKVEMDYISEGDGETKIHLVVSYSFTIGGQTVTLPTSLNTCEHDYFDDYYSLTTINDVFYHYHACSECGDIIDLGKCDFDEDGHCKVCANPALEDVVFFTVDEYDGYFSGLVYGYINAITHKVEGFYCDSFESIEITDTETYYVYEVEGIEVDNENEFIIGVEIYEYGTSRYCYAETYNFETNEDTMYILDNVTYSIIEGAEYDTISVTGNIIQTEKVGELYSKYNNN